MHADVLFDQKKWLINSQWKSISTFTPILEAQIKTGPCKTNEENEESEQNIVELTTF